MEKERMTIEGLRNFEGFESITDEEAEEVIESLYQLAEIACKSVLNEISKKKSNKDE